MCLGEQSGCFQEANIVFFCFNFDQLFSLCTPSFFSTLPPHPASFVHHSIPSPDTLCTIGMGKKKRTNKTSKAAAANADSVYTPSSKATTPAAPRPHWTTFPSSAARLRAQEGIDELEAQVYDDNRPQYMANSSSGLSSNIRHQIGPSAVPMSTGAPWSFGKYTCLVSYKQIYIVHVLD